MKAVVYTIIEQKVIKDWQSLWNKSRDANYTNSPQWFLSVLETYDYKDFVIVALYDKEQLVGIGALVKEKKYGIEIFTVAPSDFVCDNPFLLDVSDQRIVRMLRNKLKEFGAVFLDNIPEVLTVVLTKNGDAKKVQGAANYYIEIQRDNKGGVVVRNKKRLLRRSEAIEDKLTLKEFSGVNTAALEIAFAIDNKSNKQVYGYNAFSNKKVRAFYKSLQQHFQNHFLLYILYHEKKPVAYQIGFRIKKTFYCSQIAFLKEYEQYSIGRSLLIRLIETLGKTHVDIVDFGSGEDHVKRSLTKLQRPLFSLFFGENRFKSVYLTYMTETQKNIYTLLHSNKRIYAVYRKIKTR